MTFVNVVGIEQAQEANRFDAEYFDPSDLDVRADLAAQGAKELGQVARVLTGRAPDEYVEEGVLQVVRAGDLTHALIYPGCGAAFLRADANQKVCKLRKGDILISSIGMGSIGKISLVMDPTGLITVPEVTIVRDPEYAPAYLLFYLATDIGQRLLIREVTGATGQQHLLKDKAARALVPPPGDGVEDALTSLCQSIWEKEKSLAELYESGRSTLHESLAAQDPGSSA